MPIGAHEAMETHECLMEKINALTHFNLYAQQARNPQLLDMIARHQQEALRSYNEIISVAQGSGRFNPVTSNTEIRGASHQQVQYGLRSQQQFAPDAGGALNDQDIAIAMLLSHKNGARNCAWAATECADPNLRQALQNSAATCSNQAYEVFLWMNEHGLYQVPTLQNHTTENFLGSYQPAPEELQAQFAEGGRSATSFAGQGLAGSADYQQQGYQQSNVQPSSYQPSSYQQGGYQQGSYQQQQTDPQQSGYQPTPSYLNQTTGSYQPQTSAFQGQQTGGYQNQQTSAYQPQSSYQRSGSSQSGSYQPSSSFMQSGLTGSGTGTGTVGATEGANAGTAYGMNAGARNSAQYGSSASGSTAAGSITGSTAGRANTSSRTGGASSYRPTTTSAQGFDIQ